MLNAITVQFSTNDEALYFLKQAASFPFVEEIDNVKSFTKLYPTEIRSRYSQQQYLEDNSTIEGNSTNVYSNSDPVTSTSAVETENQASESHATDGDSQTSPEESSNDDGGDDYYNNEDAMEYGLSYWQLQQIKVIDLHKRGLSGNGIIVLLTDSG